MGISESIEPLVEKIEKLSKTVRIAICGGAFLLIIAPFIYSSYLPQYKKIGELKKELKTVEDELSIAKKRANQLKKVEKEIKDVEMNFAIAKKSLPEDAQIPLLLTDISRAGQDADLEFLLFEPAKAPKKKKKKKKGAQEKKPFYLPIPIEIEVLGNYHNVVLFFDKIARLNRIVNIKDIRISSSAKKSKGKSAKENELVASCMAVTYKFVEVAPSKKKDDKKKKK